MTTRNFGMEGFKWFIGVVVDILDPEQLGRVRIRVFGLHDNVNLIQDEDLPWAQILVSPTSASLGGVGITPVGIAPDSYVIGFFVDGEEAQFPIVLGTFHKMQDRDPNKNDVNVLARGTNKLVKKPIGPEPDSAYNAQYPKNQVFESKSGHIIEIDDTDGDERIHIYHRAGTYIEIDSSGKLLIRSADSSIDVSGAKKDIYAKDTITIESETNIVMKAADSISLEAPQISIAGGSSTLALKDGTADLSSSSVSVKGSSSVTVDTPTADVSGVTLSGSKVSSSAVSSSKVTAKKVASLTTGGLASSINKITSGLGGLTNLSGLSTIGDLTSALDTAFGDLQTSVLGLSNNLMDDSMEAIQKEVEEATKELESKIPQAPGGGITINS